MKQSRLLVIALPLLLAVLAFAGPFRWLQGSANTTKAEAQVLEEENAGLQRKVRAAQNAQQNEAALRAELAQIRTVLPELPEDVASPLIRTISDAALARGVLVTVQTQATNPLAPTASESEAAAALTDANGNPIDTSGPKLYSVSLTVSGNAASVVDFIGDLPTSGRLWVYKVTMNSVGEEGGFSADISNGQPGGAVEATIELRSYAGPGASASAPLPGS